MGYSLVHMRAAIQDYFACRLYFDEVRLITAQACFERANAPKRTGGRSWCID